jgi:hypothetical protein
MNVASQSCLNTEEYSLLHDPKEMLAVAEVHIHMGLAPSLHKCPAYGTPTTPAYTAAQQSARMLDIQNAANGFVAAGTPIGTDDYINAHMEDCAYQAIVLIRKLQDVSPPLTAHAEFLLLSRSLQRRLTHFSRVFALP